MEKYALHISVIIPVYKCEECLFELYIRLKQSLSRITSKFEIIFINDASPDDSWSIITELHRRDKRVKGILMSKNFGQHYAIAAGLDIAKGDWVVVMDCDLQDQPEEILKLYTKAQEGYEIVFGQRIHRQDIFLKRLVSKLFYFILSYLTETEHDPSIANFGIYKKNVIEAVVNMRENLRYFYIMVKWVGFKSTTSDVIHAKRQKGDTSYNLKKLIRLAMDVMIAFSDKPLKLTIKMGLLISFISFLFALFIIFRAILGIHVIEGWASLMVSIWFFSGLIIFTLGIVGIYLGKTFDEVKKRPLYIIKEKIL